MIKLEKNKSFRFSFFDWPFGLFRCKSGLYPSTKHGPLARWFWFTRQELPTCHLLLRLWPYWAHNAMTAYMSVSFRCLMLACLYKLSSMLALSHKVMTSHIQAFIWATTYFLRTKGFYHASMHKVQNLL